MTQEELIVAEAVFEKLEKKILYGEQGMPVNESYLYGCMSTMSLRQQRKRKGTTD